MESITTQTFRLLNKRKISRISNNQIIGQIDKMTEEEIDRISKQIDEISRGDNELRAEEIPDAHDDYGRDGDDYRQELADQVKELPEAGSAHKNSVSRGSKRSSKSYIIKLRQDLENEREQRQKLENEIEELKRISSEISSKLGLK